jgi:hypothetical protein
MAQTIEIAQNTATWLPFFAQDANGVVTGITYAQVIVSYKKAGGLALVSKTLSSTGSFREIGQGFYEISFTAAELNTLGTFAWIVSSNGLLATPIKTDFQLGTIVPVTSYSDSRVSLPTNTLTGSLIDLSGKPLVGIAVSAKLLSLPEVLGSTTLAGVCTDLISVKSDTEGFFALEVLQGATVDISIPRINYRRSLVVPANTTDELFTLA